MENKKLIDYIIATEFEIKKGNQIVAHYPSDLELSLENIMIEKFIPDGIHNFENDFISYNHLVPINKDKMLGFLENLNNRKIICNFFVNERNDDSWKFENATLFLNSDFILKIGKNLENNFDLDLNKNFQIQMMDEKTLRFKYIKNDNINSDIYFEIKEKENFTFLYIFLNLLTQKASQKIIDSLKLKENTNERAYVNMLFLTLVKNKKNKSVERGAIYKSITICTLLYEDLTIYKKYLNLIIEDYMEINSSEFEEEIYNKKILESLKHYYEKQNDIIKIKNIPYINKIFYNPNFESSQKNLETNFFELLQIFKEKIMIIYREIINEGKIFIVCKNKSIQYLNNSIKTLKEMLRPLNFCDKTVPFETLSGILLLILEKSFLAGFNNPIVRNDPNWTLYVDLDSGSIFRQDGILTNENVQSCDKLFIKKLLGLNQISERKIRRTFVNYTQMQLDILLYENEEINHITDEIDLNFVNNKNFLMNRSFSGLIFNFLKFEKFEIRKDFGKKDFGKILYALRIFTNSQFLKSQPIDNLTLLTSLYSINTICDDSNKLEIFFNFLKKKNKNLKSFLRCIFSNNENILFVFKEILIRGEDLGILKEEKENMGFLFKLVSRDVLKKEEIRK